MERTALFWTNGEEEWPPVKGCSQVPALDRPVRHLYPQVREEGLEQEFNTLNAQRDAAEAFIRSQRGEGWVALTDHYDDGGFTGANMDRPALKKLLQDVREGLVGCVMVYKVDRLTRSLLDFARIMEVLDKHSTSFVSVTLEVQHDQFLTLNILLSFAQFEREMIAERTKDKMSAARRRARWVGGIPMLG